MQRTVKGFSIFMLLATLIGGQIAVAQVMTPLERAATTPKGQLTSPYPDFATVAKKATASTWPQAAMAAMAAVAAEAWQRP